MTIKKIRGLIVFTILIFVGVWKFNIVLAALGFAWGILFPFVLGGAIAFIINVPMTFIEKKLFGSVAGHEKSSMQQTEKVGEIEKVEQSKTTVSDKEAKRALKRQHMKEKIARPVSMIITIVLVVSVIFLVIFFLVPQLGATFSVLAGNIEAFIPKLQDWVVDFTNNNKEVTKYITQLEFNPDKLVDWMLSFVGTGAGNVMNTTFAAAKSIVSGVATFFIAFSFACYVLAQKERLHVQVRKVLFAFLPRGKAEAVVGVCSLTYKTFSGFLTGQCVEAVILGSIFVVVLSIFRMPYALLIGVLIAFSALIPVFGAFIGCGLGAFLIFMVDPKQALIFVILFLVLQQIEGNFIYPHVVGNSVGLPSIWVLAAVSIGGQLMGIVGMLIFIPIVSVAYTLFREIVYVKLKKHRIKDVTKIAVEEFTPEEME